MSQPRDGRVVGSTAPGTLSSSPPQVTLEPITSFKRSLEEIGFDTGPAGDELSQGPTTTPLNITRNTNPIVVADRGYSEVPELPLSTSLMQSHVYNRPIGTTPRLMQTSRRRSSAATPPLLPPITSQRSHLLELISDFSPEPEQPRSILAESSTTGSPSASENEVFLPTTTTTRRPDPLRIPLNEQIRQRIATATPSTPSSSSTATPLNRRIFRNSSTQRTPGSSSGGTPASAIPSQPRFSFEDSVSSQRSPELPPIDTSDNGLGGLSNLLYNEPPSTAPADVPRLQASSGTSTEPRTRTNAFIPRARSFLLARPFVESPSPPITAPLTATITSTLGDTWEERAARFEAAIAPLRPTPPPQQQQQRLHQGRPSHIDTRFRMPYLPHPFEEIMSPSTPGESDDNDAASEFSWDDHRDAFRYIRDLNTVIDEREAESGELTPVLTVPVLPPIVPSPLLVVDSGLDFEQLNGRLTEEETEWEADEVPSAWLREARRHLGRPANSSSGAPPPLLELPNFSSTSLGLVEFSNGSGAVRSNAVNPNPDTAQLPATATATAAPTAPARTSQDILRRLPTEHLRQLRRVAIRSVASRSRSRSSMAPSVISSDGETASRVGEMRAESVVSNEDIVVGVPPMLDEPWDRSVLRELEGRMQAHHAHALAHGHLRPVVGATEGPRTLPALDIRRQPRISLGPLSSGLHFDSEILGQREIVNDTGSNISVRSAVASPSPGTTTTTDGELGEWRELVEGSLSSQAVPALALSAPQVSAEAHNRPWGGGNGHWRMRRLEQIRSASSMSGEPGNTRFASQSLRQTVADYREGRLSEAQLENSLGVAMLEMRAEMQSAGSFRSSALSSAGHPHADVSLSSPQPLRGAAEAEAFQLLDSVWSNSNSATVQGMSREMEYMERSLLERSAEVVPRRTHSPLWDTDDPLSEFLSDVGFDGSYEALMELSEQLGVVPRGLSDAAFGSLRTALFKDLEPDLVAMSPALSTVSHSDLGSVDLTASMTMSLTHASFASPRVRRARTGKWVAQCSICLEEYNSEDVCVTLDCTHFFHQPCVRTWFTAASTCPLCRHPLPRS